MSDSGYVLLTGATGLLGQYLLRDLTRAGTRVAVLARGHRGKPATDRIAEIVAQWGDRDGARLSPPEVLEGDLREPGLGLGLGDRTWLARRCRAVVHAGAVVSFRPTPNGEPWRTNATGTRHLLTACATLGIGEFHHVSTAFVCGDRAGTIPETDVRTGTEFHNEYERSKFEAERLVRSAREIRSTVYRPSVIVGDSRTGHTTAYHGLYKFLELADRLAGPAAGPRHLALRLPFTGAEPRDLVPVDWVSAAATQVVGSPCLHGRVFHLTAETPTSVRDIHAVAVRVLGIGGVTLAGPGPLADASEVERAFLDHLKDYWPYLAGDPTFDRANTRDALPDLPAPQVDRAALARLVRFAAADGWGRGRNRRPAHAPGIDCADYVERYFPAALPRSALAALPVDVALGLDVRGPGGGRWVCRISGGRVTEVVREDARPADATYRLDVPTFEAVVRGRETPQAAFFARRIEITGNIETGLKLAVLFGRFVEEFPYRPEGRRVPALAG